MVHIHYRDFTALDGNRGRNRARVRGSNRSRLNDRWKRTGERMRSLMYSSCLAPVAKTYKVDLFKGPRSIPYHNGVPAPSCILPVLLH
jgi:hypothetical protein